MPHPLELPVFKAAAAQKAAALGADRIELNRDGSYPAGGLTPDVSELAGLEDLKIPVRVMIRPRGPPVAAAAPLPGSSAAPEPEPDFLYSPVEFQAMRDAIAASRDSGLLKPERGDGFVFGILRRRTAGEGAEARRLHFFPPPVVVDVERNAELVELARPYVCVFHRAFDDAVGTAAPAVEGAAAEAWEAALDAVARCGFDGILTSGGPGSAPANAKMLQAIVSRAATVREGKGIEIVIGGGIRSHNVRAVAAQSSAGVDVGRQVWFHSSCLTARVGEDDIDLDEVMGLLRELR